MFHRTRKQLTVLFTGLTILFLLAFIMVTYFWLTTSIKNDQKEAVMHLAKIELAEHKHELMDWYEANDEEGRAYERDHSYSHQNAVSTNRLFYFVMAKDGKLIDAEMTRPDLYHKVLSQVKDWKPPSLEVKYVSFSGKEEEKVKLLLASISVYESGEYIGSIYTGTNVSDQQKVLNRLLGVLIVLLLLFLFLSLFLGYYMSARAMVPIERSFQRQKELVSDASHELRTPLAVFQSSLEVIEAEEQEHLSAFSRQVLQDLKDENKRMTRLVSDLLTLARSDSGEIEVVVEQFELTEVLEYMVRSVQMLAKTNNVTVDLDVPSKLMMIADKERIIQLLFILIDNAIKYNVPDGEVLVRARMNNKSIHIDIEDKGIGMPAEEINRIFDRFYRVDKARSRDLGSNGIGLSIAKWIVEAHHGSIVVKSQEGQGSVFKLTFPRGGRT